MKKYFLYSLFSIPLLLILLFFHSDYVISQVQQLSGTMIDSNQDNAGNGRQGAEWRTISAYHVEDGDNLPTVASALHGALVGAIQLGFNGSAWDRIRIGLAGDSVARTGIQASTIGLLNVGGSLNSWRDATQESLGGIGHGLVVNSFLSDQAPTIFLRNESAARADDQNDGERFGPYLPMLFNGTGTAADQEFDRARSTSGINQTATTSRGVQLVSQLSTWFETDSPAVTVAASATKTAGAAGVRHVANSITGCIEDSDSAFGTITLRLRDGTTGTGTVFRTWYMNFPAANDFRCIDITFPGMIGTAATAMTLEFAGAISANGLTTVTLTGYSVEG